MSIFQKLFLNLHGHKQPVLSIDISFDDKILISGSADRLIKIWGLDFGDCHRSIYAHDDSITMVKFIAKTHLFFTVSKDGKLKQWDADYFHRITTLEVGAKYSRSLLFFIKSFFLTYKKTE